jgi:F-type H+-transporting ATPase subunit epsilon
MSEQLMNMKILLPYKVFNETGNVKSIVAETSAGSYGLLTQRLDFAASLVPGIFTYETDAGGVHYLALDEGVMIKAGRQVLVSVRNAVEGTDLGKLHEAVEKEFLNQDSEEKNVRSLLAKMESGLMHNLEKLHNE